MAKLDNTKQVIYDIKDARVDSQDNELVLINEDAFEQPIKITDLFNGYIGQAIDLKLGGAEHITPDMFEIN